ncbi:MAG: DUF5674 family protein [bacterium]|nr:DUF5674 family protein [bacterium]
MIIVTQSIPLTVIQASHSHFFDTMVKAVVDIERGMVALDAELHADLEDLLLEAGSLQEYLWGVNIFFDNPQKIEFTSLINIRPAQNNRGMEVQDPKVKKIIEEIIFKLITPS